MSAQGSLQEMLDEAYVPGPLPTELIPTDRVMQRWAVAQGTGLGSIEWDERPISRPPPLDDATAIVVDQIVLRSPPPTRVLIRDWYKTPTPCPTMARNRRVALKSLYKLHRISLLFLRDKFEVSGHPDLIRLLGARV